MSLSSPFLKELLQTSEAATILLLPNYSSHAILALLQLLYTGEVLLESNQLDEFIGICCEFQCENQIQELLQTHKPEDSNTQEEAWFVEDKTSSDLSITRVPVLKNCLTTKVEDIEFDEYFETNCDNNVETIFFNENECEDEPESKQVEREIRNISDIKEEYLNEEYIEENHEEQVKKKPNCETSHEKEEEKSSAQLASDEDPHKKILQEHSLVKKPTYRQRSHEPQIIKNKFKREPTSQQPSITFHPIAMNINQLREEQDRFKKRLQEAINSCRGREEGSTKSIKKAAKMFGVPEISIQRSLRGFKNANNLS